MHTEDQANRSKSLPLAGRRIIVTRPRGHTDGLVRPLEALGAEVLALPTIRIVDPIDPGPLRDAADHPNRYSWIIFTSANGVFRFWQALRDAGKDARELDSVSVCAIGPATADAVEREGGRVALIPPRHVAESLVEALTAAADLSGARVLLPRADVARDVIPDVLRERGALVDDVAAYRTVLDTSAAGPIRRELACEKVDLVTFTSSSSAFNFAELSGGNLHGAEVATIGPITSSTVRELGWRVAIEAREHTTVGLVDAIRAHYLAVRE